MLRRAIWGVWVLMLVFTAEAGAGKQDEFFVALLKDMTVVNGQATVDHLAKRIESGKVTVEDFAAYYFQKQPRKRHVPENRKRWIRNMRINFRIINHQSRRYDAQKEILARRAVEVTLFRLKGESPEPRLAQ